MGSMAEENGGPRDEPIYRALRRAIIEQQLRPGTKLPEDAVGAQFKVSRTVVRRALSRLEGDGLVEFRLNRGAAVASPGREEAHDIFELRICLECEVVRRLAGRLGPHQAAALRAHAADEHALGGDDEPRSIRHAGEFHIRLAEMTGNRLLGRYVGELVSRCSLLLAAHARPHSARCTLDEHRRLVELLCAGDAEAAVEEMRRHLLKVAARAEVAAPEPPADLDSVLARYAAAGS